MKRVLIGGFLSLLGSIWGLAVILLVSDSLVSSWFTPPGRLMTTIAESGMMPVFAVSIVLVLLGVVLMGIEYFRRDG